MAASGPTRAPPSALRPAEGAPQRRDPALSAQCCSEQDASKAAAAAKPMHPLHPLTRVEIESVVRAVRSKCRPEIGDNIMFVSVSLVEPSKAAVFAYDGIDLGDGVDQHVDLGERSAFVILLDLSRNKTWEVVVAIAEGKIVSLTHVPGVQPALAPGEYEECASIVKSDPRFLAMCKERKLDPNMVVVEAWSAGNMTPDDDPARRIIRPLLYVKSRDHLHSNPYSRPLDFFCPVVDMLEKKVIKVEDLGKSNLPVPPAEDALAEYGHQFQGRFRQDIKPLVISQPEGPSFEVDGYQVRWQGFSLHLGFTAREGLVLYNVTHTRVDPLTNTVETRPIIWRAAFTEMVVPYGDPTPPNVRKNAFDAGEDGLGNSANSLTLGCDCLGCIRYFDVFLLDKYGEVMHVKNAICLHEEDDGVLWKHQDWRTGAAEIRRGRRLVVSFMASISNYTYGFYYIIRMDGSFHFQVMLTGVVNTSSLLPENTNPKYGTLVSPMLNAPIHQHFFTVKLDFAIDGLRNRVEEVQVVPSPPGPENPQRNAFYAQKTLIANERMSGREVNHAAHRHWVVSSSSRRNRHGHPTAYRLMPAHELVPFAHPRSSVMQRANFLSKAVWVTRTHPDEKWASGKYPNQRKGPDGPAEWSKKNRDLTDKEITIWYTFGTTHIVRPEQWPIMPTDRISFVLEPYGFFDANPTLDVPPSKPEALPPRPKL